MKSIKGKCTQNSRKLRHRITMALNQQLWDKFQPALRERWEGSFTSWVEFAMTCYSRDSCNDCPYEPEDDKQEKAPDGIGKVIDD